MVAEVFVGGWHMLALHVAHSSPLSTAKQIWYVMMSVFDLGGPDGLPKYFHLRFFHCLIHSHTALAGIQELTWTSSVVLTIGAVTGYSVPSISVALWTPAQVLQVSFFWAVWLASHFQYLWLQNHGDFLQIPPATRRILSTLPPSQIWHWVTAAVQLVSLVERLIII